MTVRPSVTHAPEVASAAADAGGPLRSLTSRPVAPSRRVELPSTDASDAAVYQPGNLLALQRAAGNVAVGRLLQWRAGVPLVQRADASGGPLELHYKGTLLTADRAQLRTTLEGIIAARGQNEAETFAYGFLRMPPEEKAAMQVVGGVSLEQITQIQQTFESVLHELQNEQKKFFNEFGPQVLNDTNNVLDKSKELLHQEEIKYTDTFPAQQQKPDLDGLRAAAKGLAQKRKAADAAAKTAKAANRAMVDEGRTKAEFGSPFPAPQVPFFPNPKLREMAYEANDAWWKLEQEYGTLRTDEQKKFPVLAMYSDMRPATRQNVWTTSRLPACSRTGA